MARALAPAKKSNSLSPNHAAARNPIADPTAKQARIKPTQAVGDVTSPPSTGGAQSPNSSTASTAKAHRPTLTPQVHDLVPHYDFRTMTIVRG